MKPPIRVSLLSFGSSGRIFHAPLLFANPDFQLLGALERSKKQFNGFYPGLKSYSNLDELLADKPDLVIINTPNNTHFDFANQILNNGFNVIVEKPFTVTSEEAIKLSRLAKEKNLLLTVFHNRRWDSDFLAVKNVIAENVLGDIVNAEFRFDRFNPAIGPKVHKETAVPGSGIVYDIGSHLIDQALQCFGRPHSVFAKLRMVRAGTLVVDDMDILLYYPKTTLRLKADFFVADPPPAYVLYGINGTFKKFRSDVQEKQLNGGKSPADNDFGIEPPEGAAILTVDGKSKMIPSPKGDYTMFYRLVAKAMQEKKPLPVLPEEAVMCIEVIEAAMESSRQGAIIKLP